MTAAPRPGERVKVVFRLEKDADGYPPEDVESLWGLRRPDGVLIDNIPFFVRGVALGDTVEVTPAPDGALEFSGIVRGGGHSTYRILVLRTDQGAIPEVMSELIGLGLAVEEDAGLLAVDVPPSIAVSGVLDYFEEGINAGRWEVEEGVRCAHGSEFSGVP